MKLYHFTSFYHLHKILADGFIRVTESNIGSPFKEWLPYGEHVGPDVVWLTESKEKLDNGLIGGAVDKQKIRFEIEIENAIRWRDFANQYKINPKWYRRLDITGNYTAKNWWVSTMRIPVNQENVTIL
jgi:hypothetical protein